MRYRKKGINQVKKFLLFLAFCTASQMLLHSSIADPLKATRKVILYFAKYRYENPEGSEGIPNWFYYWNQTIAGSPNARFDDCPIYGYYPNPFNPRNTIPSSVFYVCPLASEFRSMPARHTYQGMNSEICTNPPNNNWPLGGSVEGIDTFAIVVIHEGQHLLTHVELMNTPFCTGTLVDCTPLTGCDQDCDGFVHTKEVAFGTNPDLSHTHWPGTAFNDDEERSYCKEYTEWREGLADCKDWAAPGKNYDSPSGIKQGCS